MQTNYSRLLSIVNEIFDLNTAQSLLGWDLQVYMPSGGAEGRGFQQAALARIIHARNTSNELGALLEELSESIDQYDPESDQACLIQLMQKEFQKNRKLDPLWVEEYQQITSEGNIAWRSAREQADFALFRPWLEKAVKLAREYVQFFTPYDHIYDPLLDEFEPGMKTHNIQEIFNTLRPMQVDLIQEISQKTQVEDRFLNQNYPLTLQRQFVSEIVTLLGYDWQRGRLDTTAHPFTNSLGIGDVRITTRFDPDKLNTALFATIHEGGHALYEMGISPQIARTPLARGASAALHESQSRLYENLVGRSLPFWKYFFPKLQEMFSTQLGNVSLEAFYAAVNCVRPSFIRVEADEATYNLHIMLRMELEIAMLEGSLAVTDLPDAWNDRMRSYLGILPANDAAGVLQDVHWSIGLFGYFPTYALGNVIAAQLWEKIIEAIPEINQQFESGNFAPLLDWLRQNVHQFGRKYEPQALIKKITGSTIDPAPYMRYLKNKYSELYQL